MAQKEITAELVKELRDRTGVGLGKCKEALEETKGDIELAVANLRKRGMATAVKKEGRETKEGIVQVRDSGKAIALVEVNAETDFVVKNDKFQKFTHDLTEELVRHPAIALEEFLKQKYSKDPQITIDQYRSLMVSTLGENIQIKRVEIFVKKKGYSYGLYNHGQGKLITLVEIEGNEAEEALAKDIAMHIAAEAPEYLTPDEIPERVIAHEKEIASAQVTGKPANIIDKIVQGKLKAYFDQVCLVHQHYVKDPSISVGQLVEKRGKEVNKSLKITQFLRWKVGD